MILVWEEISAAALPETRRPLAFVDSLCPESLIPEGWVWPSREEIRSSEGRDELFAPLRRTREGRQALPDRLIPEGRIELQAPFNRMFEGRSARLKMRSFAPDWISPKRTLPKVLKGGKIRILP
jgi:hypothetical protein